MHSTKNIHHYSGPARAFLTHIMYTPEGVLFSRDQKNAGSGNSKTEEFSDFGAPKGVTVHVHFGSWGGEARPEERVRYDLRSERQVQEGKVVPSNASKTSQRHSTSIYNTPSPLRVTTLRQSVGFLKWTNSQRWCMKGENVLLVHTSKSFGSFSILISDLDSTH